MSTRTDFVVRTLVWLGALAWWLYLRLPKGASLRDVRPGLPGVVGALLTIGGAAVYVWAARRLAGVAATPETLLSSGPYRYVRNPLYLAAAAVFAGASTMYAPWRARDVPAVTIIAVLAHLFVVRHEEPATRRRLGAAYDDYCARVPRWIPRISA